MNRVEKCGGQVERGGHVVCEATYGVELSGTVFSLPDAKEFDEEVVGVAVEDHLGDEEDV